MFRQAAHNATIKRMESLWEHSECHYLQREKTWNGGEASQI